MNAQFSTIDIDAPAAAEVLLPAVSLATVETLTPAIVFVPGGVERILSKLEAEVRAIDRDISTAAGRKAVAALAYKVARSKTGLDDMGKELVAGIKKQAGLIDADRRIIRDRLEALQTEVRAPLTAYEAAEENRVAGHESAIVFFIESRNFRGTAAEMQSRAATVAGIIDGREWQEFHERATAAALEAMETLQSAVAAAIQAEADAAELAELRRERVAREETDRIAAEQRAESERSAAYAEQEAIRERQRQERATREAEAAAGRAVEMERQRVAKVKAAAKAAEDKRAADTAHRANVHSAITLALSEVLTGNADEAAALIEAMAAGRIPHVSITY